MDERLRPIERIQTSSEYRKIFQGGERFFAPHLRVHYRKSDREFSRLGLVVSRKVGKAHVRTRVKRLLREAFRRSKRRMPFTADVVLVPRRGPATMRQFEDSFVLFTDFLERRRSGSENRGTTRRKRRSDTATARRRAKISQGPSAPGDHR